MTRMSEGQRDLPLLRDQDIIYFSCIPWGPIKARPQQIAIQLARENRVLYVEPMLSVVTRVLQGLESPFPRLYRIKDRLFVYRPPSLLPFSLRSDRANRINKWLLRASLRRVAKALGLARPILGTSHPQHEALIGHFQEIFSFYDCMDNYGALPDPRANSSLLTRMERRLLVKVDHIFTSSQALLDEMNGFSEKCTLIRNGVTVSHYSDAVDSDARPPAELRVIPQPIIGFIGSLGEWVDGEALVFLARARPDWSLVLIGPILDRVLAKRLQSVRNIYLLGTKNHDDLPALVRWFAVALIPFELTRLTRAVDPVKLYEYLAAGRPIVTSDLPEVRRFGDLVSIYYSREQLVRLIETHLQETGTMEQMRRRRAAMDNTWENRAACMAGVLSQRFQEMNVQTCIHTAEKPISNISPCL